MTDAPDSFADTPKSIGELRADRTGLAKDLSVRDTVIRFLRDLDAGDLGDLSFVCICFAKRDEKGILVNEYAGGMHTPLEMIGLVEQVKHRLFRHIDR